MSEDRQQRLLKRVGSKMAAEEKALLERLRARSDYGPAREYFLTLASQLAAGQVETEGRPLANLLCIQAPLELIDAAGFHPFRRFCGSAAAGNLAAKDLPALVCPLLRSFLGERLLKGQAPGLWVLPTTCDWVVKLPEMARHLGLAEPEHLHILELPHFKERPESQRRWLEEIRGLKLKLEQISGRRLGRKELRASLARFQRAWSLLMSLAALRDEGRLAGPWFLLAANTMLAGPLPKWCSAAEALAAEAAASPADEGRPRVFLAGSPIFYPNFKLPLLLEEAGLALAADDLCSGERFLPGAVTAADDSLDGLLEALAQRYQQGCLCPTFGDNDRRLNNILGRRCRSPLDGVVFGVLKGCHPYELESITLEEKIKSQGLGFIRLETDYSSEDSQNLLTRLEAFRQTLRSLC